MATNLIATVLQYLPPDVIMKIAHSLGLDRDIALKMVKGAVPALLASFADVVSSPGGPRQFAGALAQQQPGALDGFRNLLGTSSQRAAVDSGSNLLSGLLGGGTLDGLTQSISKFSGASDSQSKSLLGLLGPLVLGALGQQQRNAGLDSAGLASMLMSQKDQLAAAIPAGLAERMDAAGLTAAASRIGGAAERTIGGIGDTAYSTTQAARSAASASHWGYWVLGLAALGAVGWLLLNAVSDDDPKIAELPPPAVTTPPPARQTFGTVGLSTPDMTVDGVDVATRVASSVGTLRAALATVTDATSAQEALPKIREAMTNLDEINALSSKLTPEGKYALARMVTAAMPTINQLCDRVVATPGAGVIAKPAIDDLRGKLVILAKI